MNISAVEFKPDRLVTATDRVLDAELLTYNKNRLTKPFTPRSKL